MRCSPTVKVDRLSPFFERADEPPLPARSLTRGRRASTRWTCCSTAGWWGGLPSTLSAGGAKPRRQMPDGGWRRWTVAATWWRSTTPSGPTTTRAAPRLAGPSFGARARDESDRDGPAARATLRVSHGESSLEPRLSQTRTKIWTPGQARAPGQRGLPGTSRGGGGGRGGGPGRPRRPSSFTVVGMVRQCHGERHGRIRVGYRDCDGIRVGYRACDGQGPSHCCKPNDESPRGTQVTTGRGPGD